MKSNLSILSTIKGKMFLVISLLLIVPNILIGLICYNVAKEELDKRGEIMLKNSVKLAHMVIDAKQDEVDAGLITLEQAQEDVKEYLIGPLNSDGTRNIKKDVNLGENGHFIIYDKAGTEIAHPRIEGKNVLEVTDMANENFYLVKDQLEKAINGGGYTFYSWNLPDSEEIAEKITYSEIEPNWDWIVIAGSFLSDYNSGINRMKVSFISIMLANFFIGAIIIILFTNHISRPLKKITAVVNEIADGKLNMSAIEVKNKDETGRLAISFNNMLINVRGLVGTVKESFSDVQKSSEGLSSITSQTSTNVAEVAQSIDSISKLTVKQAKDSEVGLEKLINLSKKIEYVNDISTRMHDTSSETGNLSNKGLSAVKELQVASDNSSSSWQKVMQAIEKVDNRTNEIGTIIDTISQIAVQTNLLALNAAIEAARAGDHGAGFAVVADEVRKLAEESSLASEEIKALIERIQDQSSTAVNAMNDAVDSVNEQGQSVERTENIFQNIQHSLNGLINDVNVIKVEIDDVSKSKDEIVSIINGFSEAAEETSCSTQQVAAMSQEQLAALTEVTNHGENLNRLAIELETAVNKFEI